MRFLRARIKSFAYAFKGLFIAFREEPNMWIHCAAAMVAVLLGLHFGIMRHEWLVVIFCIALVIALELVNTAIETLADRISTEKDPLLGRAKDVAAGAVLMAAISAAIIGLMIFLPYILN